MSYYLHRKNISASKQCMIFDLDQTLIATQDEDFRVLDSIKADRKYRELHDRLYHLTAAPEEGDDSPYSFWGCFRPGAVDFVKFCFDHFRVVGVWSAGTHNYVHEIVKELFHNRVGKKPHVVFTRRDIVGNIDEEIFKPLDKIFNHNEVFARYTGPHNTFILDDNYGTASYNEDNIIHIPAYTPDPHPKSMTEPEKSLDQLKNWLVQDQVITSPDVRLIDKSNIFSKLS